MKKSNFTVEYEENGNHIEEHLMAYSEEERQQNRINEANAQLVFLPEFIPFYPAIKKEFKLSDIETLLFGFIKFFLTNASDKFYFTNDQLSSLFDCSIPTITRSIKTLEDGGIIRTRRKVKSGGGQIRFLEPTNQFSSVRLIKMISKTNQNHRTNNNKINNNKINISSKKKIKKNGLGGDFVKYADYLDD